METKFLSCELLGKRGVLWSRLAADIEAIQMHLVTTTCREGDMAAGIEECCTVVLTMVRVIWRELRKVRVEAETSYGLETHAVKVGQYLWGTLQALRVMENFLRTQLRQHPEVSPQITMYMFEHRAPLVEVSALNQKIEAQTKTLSQTEKTCRKLWPRVDLLTEKENNLVKK